MQLLIPYALVDTPGCIQAAMGLQLPALEQLLRRLTPTDADKGSEDDLSLPQERQLARACGLPVDDGRIPLAALALAQSGADPGRHGWAWITPAHWQIGVDHVLMHDPAALQLRDDESRGLLQAMAPYFQQDGIALRYLASGRWLGCGELLADLRSASLDRVVGSDVGPWMPETPGLRRLQNEMQMLLYAHPVNDARSAAGLAGVNSFWISGSGRLEHPPALAQAPMVAEHLRTAALAEDWPAWGQAWSQLDQGPCRDLLAEFDAGRPARLTLCSKRHALVFESVARGRIDRIRRRFSRTRLHDFAGQL